MQTSTGAMPQAQQTAGSVRRALPNALTMLRLLIAAAFFVFLGIGSVRIASGHDHWVIVPFSTRTLLWLTAVLFIVGALTDALDGYLARRWNTITVFGRIMDPFADKVLVVGAFICLCGPKFQVTLPDGTHDQLTGVAPWMAVTVLARELLVTSIRGWFESQGIDFSASLTGKLKMIFQSVSIPAILILLAWTNADPPTWVRLAIDIICWLMVVMTILSAIPYIHRAVGTARALPPPPQDGGSGAA
ncbi:MAG: hypothetical protein AMXMBFR58_37080 [Phycisphaerae bacterium]